MLFWKEHKWAPLKHHLHHSAPKTTELPSLVSSGKVFSPCRLWVLMMLLTLRLILDQNSGTGCTENKKADKLKSPVLCACSDGNHLYVWYKHKLSGFVAASLQRLAFFLPSDGDRRAWATFHAGSKIEMIGGEKRKWQHPPPQLGLCSVTKYQHLQSRDFSRPARSCQLVTGLFFYSFKLSFLFNCSLCSPSINLKAATQPINWADKC